MTPTHRRKAEMVEAWQYTGQPKEEWPDWVNRLVKHVNDDGHPAFILGDRGHFRLWPDHYIIRFADGYIDIRASYSIERLYEPIPPLPSPEGTARKIVWDWARQEQTGEVRNTRELCSLIASAIRERDRQMGVTHAE